MSLLGRRSAYTVLFATSLAACSGGDDKKSCAEADKTLAVSELDVEPYDAGLQISTVRDLRSFGGGYLAAFAGKEGADWVAGLLRVDLGTGEVEKISYRVFATPKENYTVQTPRADIVADGDAAIGYVLFPQEQMNGEVLLASGLITIGGRFSRGSEEAALVSPSGGPALPVQAGTKELTRIAEAGGGAVAAWLADDTNLGRRLFAASLKKDGATITATPFMESIEGVFSKDRAFDLYGVAGGALVAYVVKKGEMHEVTVRKAASDGTLGAAHAVATFAGIPEVAFVRDAAVPTLYTFIGGQRTHQVVRLGADGAPSGAAVDLGERSPAATVIAPPVQVGERYLLAEITGADVSVTMADPAGGMPQRAVVYASGMGPSAARDALTYRGMGQLALAGTAQGGALGLAQFKAELACPAR